MESKAKTVCMISCLHPLKDDRIYWKESVSLQKHGYKVVHIGVSERAYDEISEHGIRLISLKRKQYFRNPFIDKIFRTITFRPNIYSEILKTAATINADVYHFHDYQINRIGKALKRLPQKPKVVYDVHEPYPEIIKYLHKSSGIVKFVRIFYGNYLDNWQKKCALDYDTVVTTEENVANSFSNFIGYEKVKVIYNYCDFEPISLNLEEKKEYDLIYIGGISSWRGIFELLEVAKLAKEQNINIRILFLGHFKEPHLKEKVQKFVNYHKIQEYFEYIENLPHNEVSKYLHKSRIGLCVFRDNPVYRIIMPIKIFEYLAVGLPIIANNFGHTNQIIEKQKVGIAISEISPESILNSALEILNNKDVYNEFSMNGKATLEKYSWKRMELKLLELYTTLCPQS